MSTLHPHADHDDGDAAPVVITADDQRSALERENQRLRATVKALEGALRCAAKLLRPYADRAMR
jgi:hypothetical protein